MTMPTTINSKILLSGTAIVAAAVLIVGATFAFFSDTETSEGNTIKAGSLDLKVDSQAHYNGLVCVDGDGGLTWEVPEGGQSVGPDHYPQPGDECVGTWDETDINGEEFAFFSLVDVKPGDDGENTISLHVTDNDAWGQFTVTDVQDLDNTCTEPEGEEEQAGDPACDADGELAQSITFDAWIDEGTTPGFQCNNPEVPATTGASCEADSAEGDNILNGVEALFWDDETVDAVSEGPFAFSEVLGAAYSAHSCTEATGKTDYALCHGLASDGRMVGSATYYFGLAWSVPTTVGNEAQTDSLNANMVFEVEQHRNNPDPFTI